MCVGYVLGIFWFGVLVLLMSDVGLGVINFGYCFGDIVMVLFVGFVLVVSFNLVLVWFLGKVIGWEVCSCGFNV